MQAPVPAPLTAPWRIAQALSVGTALGVVALLIVRPALGLYLTWSVLVPLVPLSLLLAPQVWRNLCPIAVVHQLPLHLGVGGRRRLSASLQRCAPLVAIALFVAIVPLRLVVLDASGPALAGFVVAVLAAAVLGGVLVTGKGGWCATVCPVLPVERLYGQEPIVDAPHAHCAVCTGCIRSCYDLKPERSLDELVEGRKPGVLRRPMGVFAVAFPGFVLGYFTLASGAEAAGAGALEIYAWVLAFAAASALLGGAVQRGARVSDRGMVRASAALAAGAYYWFSVPGLFASAHDVLGVPTASGVVLAVRVACVVVAAAWFARASLVSRPPRRGWIRRPATLQ